MIYDVNIPRENMETVPMRQLATKAKLPYEKVNILRNRSHRESTNSFIDVFVWRAVAIYFSLLWKFVRKQFNTRFQRLEQKKTYVRTLW